MLSRSRQSALGDLPCNVNLPLLLLLVVSLSPCLTAGALASEPTTSSKGGSSRALVIAIADYGSSGWPNLTEVHGDADRVRAVLEDQWEVLLHHDLKREELHTKIRTFFEGGKKNDRLLLYYAGHGVAKNVRFGESNKYRGYLLTAGFPDEATTSSTPEQSDSSAPQQSDPSTPESGFGTISIPIKFLWDQAKGSEAKHVLVVIDACQISDELHGMTKRELQIQVPLDDPSRELRSSETRAEMWKSGKVRDEPSRSFITSGYGIGKVDSSSGFNLAFVDALQFTDERGADGVVMMGTMDGIAKQKAHHGLMDSIIDPFELDFYITLHLFNNNPYGVFDPQHSWTGLGRMVLLTDTHRTTSVQAVNEDGDQ